MKKRGVQSAAVFLVTVFLATNCLFAHMPQASLWNERRLASAASSLLQSPAALPHVQSSPIASIPNRFAVQNPSLTSLFEALPASLGSVRQVLAPKNAKSGRVVLHIQDVHRNNEAQANIGSTLRALAEKKMLSTVALEGAWANIDLSLYRNWPEKEPIRQLADYLLRENMISGPIHAALFGSYSAIGIDDEKHYFANVDAYKAAAPLAAAQKKKVVMWKKDLAERKFSVLSAQLAAFDQKVEAYRAGELSLGDFVEICHREEPVNGGRRGDLKANVRFFLEALQLEHSLNFSRVESERNVLLSALVPKLSKEKSSELMTISVAFRSGRVSQGDFYSYLQKLCRTNGVALEKYPAMASYLKYVTLSDAIDADQLFAELNALEKSIYASLVKTPAEKALIAESKRAHLVGKLLDFALTKEEWQEYRRVVLSSQFSVLSQNLRTNQLRTENFESFYNEAEIRDEKMAANVLSSSAALEKGVTVLVTGGFHSTGIDQRLVNAGLTVVTFVPKISKVDTENGSAYLSAFTQEKTPLERLFEGQKLFLSERAAERLPVAAAAILPAFYPNAQLIYDRLAAGHPKEVDATVGGTPERQEVELMFKDPFDRITTVVDVVKSPTEITDVNSDTSFGVAAVLAAGAMQLESFLGNDPLPLILRRVLGLSWQLRNRTLREFLAEVADNLSGWKPSSPARVAREALSDFYDNFIRSQNEFEDDNLRDIVSQSLPFFEKLFLEAPDAFDVLMQRVLRVGAFARSASDELLLQKQLDFLLPKYFEIKTDKPFVVRVLRDSGWGRNLFFIDKASHIIWAFESAIEGLEIMASNLGFDDEYGYQRALIHEILHFLGFRQEDLVAIGAGPMVVGEKSLTIRGIAIEAREFAVRNSRGARNEGPRARAIKGIKALALAPGLGRFLYKNIPAKYHGWVPVIGAFIEAIVTAAWFILGYSLKQTPLFAVVFVIMAVMIHDEVFFGRSTEPVKAPWFARVFIGVAALLLAWPFIEVANGLSHGNVPMMKALWPLVQAGLISGVLHILYDGITWFLDFGGPLLMAPGGGPKDSTPLVSIPAMRVMRPIGYAGSLAAPVFEGNTVHFLHADLRRGYIWERSLDLTTGIDEEVQVAGNRLIVQADRAVSMMQRAGGWAAYVDEGGVYVQNIDGDEKPVRIHPVKNDPVYIQLSPSGDRLLVSMPYALEMWDVKTQKRIGVIDTNSLDSRRIDAFAFSPNEERVAFSDGESIWMVKVDNIPADGTPVLQTESFLWKRSTAGVLTLGFIDNTGDQLWVGYRNGMHARFDVNSGVIGDTVRLGDMLVVPPSLPYYAAYVHAPQFNSGSSLVYLFEKETDRLIACLASGLDNVEGVAFSPDGKKLVATTHQEADRQAAIWDLDRILNVSPATDLEKQLARSRADFPFGLERVQVLQALSEIDRLVAARWRKAYDALPSPGAQQAALLAFYLLHTEVMEGADVDILLRNLKKWDEQARARNGEEHRVGWEFHTAIAEKDAKGPLIQQFLEVFMRAPENLDEHGQIKISTKMEDGGLEIQTLPSYDTRVQAEIQRLWQRVLAREGIQISWAQTGGVNMSWVHMNFSGKRSLRSGNVGLARWVAIARDLDNEVGRDPSFPKSQLYKAYDTRDPRESQLTKDSNAPAWRRFRTEVTGMVLLPHEYAPSGYTIPSSDPALHHRYNNRLYAAINDVMVGAWENVVYDAVRRVLSDALGDDSDPREAIVRQTADLPLDAMDLPPYDGLAAEGMLRATYFGRGRVFPSSKKIEGILRDAFSRRGLALEIDSTLLIDPALLDLLNRLLAPPSHVDDLINHGTWGWGLECSLNGIRADLRAAPMGNQSYIAYQGFVDELRRRDQFLTGTPMLIRSDGAYFLNHRNQWEIMLNVFLPEGLHQFLLDRNVTVAIMTGKNSGNDAWWNELATFLDPRYLRTAIPISMSEAGPGMIRAQQGLNTLFGYVGETFYDRQMEAPRPASFIVGDRNLQGAPHRDESAPVSAYIPASPQLSHALRQELHRPFKLMVFDKDGTLIDTLTQLAPSTHEYLNDIERMSPATRFAVNSADNLGGIQNQVTNHLSPRLRRKTLAFTMGAGYQLSEKEEDKLLHEHLLLAELGTDGLGHLMEGIVVGGVCSKFKNELIAQGVQQHLSITVFPTKITIDIFDRNNPGVRVAPATLEEMRLELSRLIAADENPEIQKLKVSQSSLALEISFDDKADNIALMVAIVAKQLGVSEEEVWRDTFAAGDSQNDVVMLNRVAAAGGTAIWEGQEWHPDLDTRVWHSPVHYRQGTDTALRENANYLKYVSAVEPVAMQARKDFSLSSAVLRKIADDFKAQMMGGITGRKRSLKMLQDPDVFPDLITGQETGKGLVVSIGGTNCTFDKFEFFGNGDFAKDPDMSRGFRIDHHRKDMAGVFDQIAEEIKGSLGGDTQPYSVTMVAAFALEKKDGKTMITSLSKGWEDTPERPVINQDLLELFNNTMVRHGLPNVTASLAVNDTYNPQAIQTYIMRGKDPEAPVVDLGAILGTGENQAGLVGMFGSINFESGGYDLGELWDLYATPEDRIIDEYSPKGRQRHEKMVAADFLGELFRLRMLREAHKHGGFEWIKFVPFFRAQNRMKSKYLSMIAADNTTDLSQIDTLFHKMGALSGSRFTITYEERAAMKRIAADIVERSADLAAMEYVSYIEFTEDSERGVAAVSGAEYKPRDFHIAIEGSLFAKYPGYPDLIRRGLVKLMGAERAARVHLHTVNIPGAGAALLGIIADKVRRGELRNPRAKTQQPNFDLAGAIAKNVMTADGKKVDTDKVRNAHKGESTWVAFHYLVWVAILGVLCNVGVFFIPGAYDWRWIVIPALMAASYPAAKGIHYVVSTFFLRAHGKDAIVRTGKDTYEKTPMTAELRIQLWNGILDFHWFGFWGTFGMLVLVLAFPFHKPLSLILAALLFGGMLLKLMGDHEEWNLRRKTDEVVATILKETPLSRDIKNFGKPQSLKKAIAAARAVEIKRGFKNGALQVSLIDSALLRTKPKEARAAIQEMLAGNTEEGAENVFVAEPDVMALAQSMVGEHGKVVPFLFGLVEGEELPGVSVRAVLAHLEALQISAHGRPIRMLCSAGLTPYVDDLPIELQNILTLTLFSGMKRAIPLLIIKEAEVTAALIALRQV